MRSYSDVSKVNLTSGLSEFFSPASESASSKLWLPVGCRYRLRKWSFISASLFPAAQRFLAYPTPLLGKVLAWSRLLLQDTRDVCSWVQLRLDRGSRWEKLFQFYSGMSDPRWLTEEQRPNCRVTNLKGWKLFFLLVILEALENRKFGVFWWKL